VVSTQVTVDGEESVAEVTAKPDSDGSLVSRVVPALPYLILGTVFLAMVEIAASPLNNMDTYFHLRYGHEFLSGAWSLRHPGSVSTFGTAHWVPTQWLPEVVMAQFQNWFGLAGVAWLAGLLYLTLAMSVFLVARRSSSAWVAVGVTILTLTACTPGMSMRPQQVSYLLVVATAAAWVRAQERRRAPWWLVPATWVWAMCHGMWPIGIVIGVVAIAGMALDRQGTPRELIRMSLVPVLSVAVSFVTPVGPGLLGAVLLVNSRGKYFSEWDPPDFTHFYCLSLLVLIGLAVVPRLRRGDNRWFPILMIGLASGWAVYSLRTVPVAACLLIPFAASGAQLALGGKATSLVRAERLAVLGSYVAALVGLALLVPGTAAKPPAQPTWEDGALRALPNGTKVLDQSAYGGYLMWRYPNLDVVSHGYGDAFTDQQLANVATIERVEPHWDTLVRATHAEYAVVDPRSSIGYALEHVEHWTVIHTSPRLVMLRPPAGFYD
jgi:hypothetical protein